MTSTLARQLIRLHETVTPPAPRTTCFWCGLPLSKGTCADCDRDGGLDDTAKASR